MDDIDHDIDKLAGEIATFGSLLRAFDQCTGNTLTIDAETLSEMGVMIEKRALRIRERLSDRET